ncbi:DUF4365 domain-containing protein [Aquimarina aquimarini]|uniref:DUF4365 domain-containing protein n=1 Tax=Aquimarina aquimarini TaxID=1191734 RepID=UPI000D560243|nr:DUF4365 domain-containing protein [Aquimarina aquimarini]
MTDFLDSMQLPNSNEQEELEQLSKDKLRPLFDLTLFEIREEVYRDKGVDLDIELKYDNKYTNFRFIVQLKATETIEENSDGSYSKSIDTSNIQYLFNSGKQAYYVLYHKPSNEFYYASINEFIKKLSNSNENWESQKTNTLRFDSGVNSQVVEEIYRNVLERGKNLRKLNQRIALSSSDNFGKISITDENLSFYSEDEIRDKLEQFGLGLVNEGNSKLVVKAASLVSKNLQLGYAKFNLVTAIANYNLGNMLESLSLLKQAEKDKEDLRKEDLSLLDYFTAKVRYSLGIMTNEEYFEKITTIEESSFIQYYVKIESLGRKHNDGSGVYSLNNYKKDLDELIDGEDVPKSIVNIAKSEYYKYWSMDINLRGLQNSMLVNKEVSSPGIINSIESQQKQIIELEHYHKEIQEKIIKDKDFFNYWLLETYRINYHYESFVISKIISDSEGVLKADNDEIFNRINFLIDEIRKIELKYDEINHIENKIVCMTQEYEMLLFLNKSEEANKLGNEIANIIDLYELRDFKRRFNLLSSGDTKFFRLKEFLEEAIKEHDDKIEKVKVYTDKVAELDEKDKERQSLLGKEIYTIDLFPLGYYSFEKEKLQIFYNILEIKDNKLTEQLEQMFELVIPQLNLFKEIIIEEGYLNGIREYEGLNSWKLACERREKFFENEIIRVKLLP